MMIDLTKGDIDKHLIKLALPGIGGGLMFTMFNITDTYFVGKLGTESLAAMGFTFPIVMLASAIAMGISAGAASVLSRAAGKNDRYLMKRTATDGILLSIIVVLLFSVIGILTMDIVFPLLGADELTLPIVKEYMIVWYSCSVVVLMPPISDASMRAVGDTFRPFIVMSVCAVMNIILDPILIFGWFGFPALGVKGAAIATVISRFGGMLTTLYFVHSHHKLIEFKIPKFNEITESWKNILCVGIPAICIAIFPQLLRSMLTSQAASTGGVVAVAAIAVGSRIEGFAYIVTQAIGTSLVPVIGQNWGAKCIDRVSHTRKLINKHAILLGIIIMTIMTVIAEPTIKLFTKDADVITYTVRYIRILMIGAIGLNLYSWNCQALNSVGKATWSLVINGGGTVIFMIPLLYLGSKFSFSVMILGLVIGQIIVGIISVYIAREQLKYEGAMEMFEYSI
ncbi:MAG: MATE family efflux transporter [Vallitalea sp.]|jgi:putative MATE family efflux protein|nr:MATE family efflux transporter [Vallitalea sp.]